MRKFLPVFIISALLPLAAEAQFVPEEVAKTVSPTRAEKPFTAEIRLINKKTDRLHDFTLRPGDMAVHENLRFAVRICKKADQQKHGRIYVWLDVESKEKLIYSGWMVNDLPGIAGIEHPIYEMRVLDCRFQ